MVRLLVVVLFAWFVCTLSEQPYEHQLNRTRSVEEGHAVRSFVDIFGAIELTNTVSGYLQAAEVRWYVLHLDPHQVTDFSIAYQDSTNARSANFNIFQGGTSTTYSLQGNITYLTLASHCPEHAVKYYFQLQAYNYKGSNFILSINKRSSDYSAGGINFTGTVQFLGYGNIGFPVSTQCQRLVFDVTLSIPISNDNINLVYQCQPYNNYCQYGRVPQTIYKGYNTNITHYQFFVNCTTPGTYYINMHTAGVTSYNVTTQGYSCPSGCWMGGMCDLDSGMCVCKAGYQGANCSVPSSTPTQAIVNISADSTTLNVANALQNKDTVFRLDFTPSSTQTVRLRLFVNWANSHVNKYVYFNLRSPATPNNYTGYFYLYASANVSREVRLCASSGPWYFYFATYTGQNILITADMVDIAVISGNIFSGSASSPQPSLVPVVYMFQPTASSVTIQVNETSPLLRGVYFYDSCKIFVDPENGNSFWSASDGQYGYGQYQVSRTSLATTKTYYVVVMAAPGASFTAALSYNTPGTCIGDCSGTTNGFCTPESVCMCRKGYSGAYCSDVTLPTGYIQAQPQQTSVLHLPGGNFYDGIVYVAAPLIPAGYSMIMLVSASTDTLVFIDNKFPVASTLSTASMTLMKSQEQMRTLDNCVVRAPTQWYAAFASPNQIGGDVSVTFNLTQSTLPSDGTPTAIAFHANNNYYQAQLPASCNGAYAVIVDGSIGFAYAGEGRESCLSVSEYYVDYLGNTSYGVVVPILNCTSVIDIQIYSYANYKANVTIVPTTPCPNNCNTFGKCTLAGKCTCDYPFFGDDCGTLDTVCTVIPDDSVCQSTAPSLFSDNIEQDPSLSYCHVQYDAIDVVYELNILASYLINPHDQLSIDCQHEHQQILCDGFKLKCQAQTGGGVKVMLPCNSLTWVQRCGAQYNYGGYNYYLNNVVSNVNTWRQQHPGLYICNPNPFNSSAYVTTITTSRPTSSTTSRPTSSTTSSTTSRPNSTTTASTTSRPGFTSSTSGAPVTTTSSGSATSPCVATVLLLLLIPLLS